MTQQDSKQPVWLLDFDGTITTRDSFMPFVFFLAHKTQAWRKLIVVAWFLLLFGLGFIPARDVKEKILYLFLKGKSESEVQALGSEFVTLLCANCPDASRLKSAASLDLDSTLQSTSAQAANSVSAQAANSVSTQTANSASAQAANSVSAQAANSASCTSHLAASKASASAELSASNSTCSGDSSALTAEASLNSLAISAASQSGAFASQSGALSAAKSGSALSSGCQSSSQTGTKSPGMDTWYFRLLQRIGLFPPLTLRPFFFEILQKAAAEHGRVIIVSASLDIYLKPFTELFGCELVCTQTQYTTSGYELKFATPNCVKEEKVKGIIARLGELQDYDVQAYGNSSDDWAMLSLVQEPAHAHFNDFKEPSKLNQFKLYLKLMRVQQYVKNCFVFIPIFFAGKFFEPALLGQSFLCFLVFCLVASFIYVLNDMRDVSEDRNHALKRFRPIASGQVTMQQAKILAICLGLVMLILGALVLPLAAMGMVLLYLVLHLMYVYILKYVSLLDIVCVALGFNLRVFAGGFACGVSISAWLVLMVFLLSMFLVMGKRWDDLARHDLNPKLEIRPALYGYNKEFALSSLTFLSAITTVCYILYCLDAEVQIRLHSQYVYISVLWVIMGNLRYLQHIFVFKDSFSPSKILYKDRMLQLCLLAWMLNMLFLVYI